jgi:hypothetical protein
VIKGVAVARRKWQSAGWPHNACLPVGGVIDWWPCRPAGYRVTGCNALQAFIEPWTQKRPGSITRLGVFARVAPGAGESVETRVAFDDCSMGAIQYTPTLVLGTGIQSDFIEWDEGVYPFLKGWVIWIEHRAQGGTTANDLEWVVEVSTV